MSKQAKEQLSALPSRVSNGIEGSSLTARSKPDAPVKMTLYISKGIAKEFKKLAIDEELDYSQLAEKAFLEFVQNHSTYAS